MKLIFGLGNPGKKYELTRHNVGYLVIDQLVNQARVLNLKRQNLGKKFFSEIFVINNKIFLAKPLTFMNKSGKAVKAVMKFYKISLENLIVISDDLDLELGKIRERDSGSSGGHKGLQSIIDELGTDKFKRIKIGIGRSKVIPPEKWVLQKFSKEEKKIIDEAVEKVVKKLALLG